MNRFPHFVSKLLIIATLGFLSSVAAAASWAVAPSDTVTIRGAELQARADHYTQLAAFYRERSKLSSKHMITYFTAANRADWLAKRYHLAAAEQGHRG